MNKTIADNTLSRHQANRWQIQRRTLFIVVLIALTGASGGAVSGIVVANSSYAMLSLAGGIMSLLLIPVVIWSRRRPSARKRNERMSIGR